MDEYKQNVYDRDPDHWNKIDAGDVSYMLGVKAKLNCKPFSYFLERVAPDMLERYPPVEPPVFASGGVSFLFISVNT
jgi:polypeptide N-acetylgalactosaminyltransferase